MKIGIMGGTFNPVHVGHMLLGEFAYEQFELDEIWFMPNGNPPHKEVISWKNALSHRIEMLRLAIDGVPYFRLSLHEADDSKHSYTYKTLKELKELYPDNVYYFIIGGDSLFSLEKWRNFREIFPSCILLAAMRDDNRIEDMTAQIQYLKQNYGADIRLLKIPKFEISSTELRERVQKNKSIKYLVPDAVENFIKEHHLYQTEENHHVRF